MLDSLLADTEIHFIISYVTGLPGMYGLCCHKDCAYNPQLLPLLTQTTLDSCYCSCRLLRRSPVPSISLHLETLLPRAPNEAKSSWRHFSCIPTRSCFAPAVENRASIAKALSYRTTIASIDHTSSFESVEVTKSRSPYEELSLTVADFMVGALRDVPVLVVLSSMMSFISVQMPWLGPRKSFK